MNENAVNCLSARDKMRSYLKHPGSFVLMLLVMLAALVTFAVLIFLIIYILVNGLPYMKPSLFSLHYTSENASVIPALVNTVVMTLLSLLIAVPFGIFSAVFLVEYAGRENKFIDVNPVNRIWPVRYVVLCECTALGIFNPGRSVYLIHYDSSINYENNGRSFKIGSGLLPGRKFRTGSRQAEDGI